VETRRYCLMASHVDARAVPRQPDRLSKDLHQLRYRRYLRDEPEVTAEGIRHSTMTGRHPGGPAFLLLPTPGSSRDRLPDIQKRGRPHKDCGE